MKHTFSSRENLLRENKHTPGGVLVIKKQNVSTKQQNCTAKIAKPSELGLKVSRLLIVKCKVKVPLNLAVLGIFKISRNHKVGTERSVHRTAFLLRHFVVNMRYCW